jgi:cysteine desulfurase family protein
MVYLDNAATSFPKAPGVAESVFDYLKTNGANAGRSSYKTAQIVSSVIFETRELLATLLHIDNSERIVFTNNATQALNTAIFGLAKRSSLILTSCMEHNSVMRPLRYLEAEKNCRLEFFKSDSFGFPDLEDFHRKVSQKPLFVITTACSNVTGAIFPYLQMAKIAKQYSVPFCLDAAQLVGDLPVDFSTNDIDIVCFSGHKGLLGPSGTGGIYINETIDLKPLFRGGTGSKSESETQPDFFPDKFESGTPNVAGIFGLKTALEFILQESIEKIFSKKQELFSYFYTELSELKAFDIFSSLDNQIGILSVSPRFCNLTEFAQKLNENDIAVRMGLHCAPSAHKTIGAFSNGGTIRFSLGYFTEFEELNHVISVIKSLIYHAK